MYHFIINPASRSGKGRAIWGDLESILQKEQIEYQSYLTQSDLNATMIIKTIIKSHPTGELRLYVLGGDGTINEVLQGIGHDGIQNFDRVILGYLPTGSSNDLARALDYSDDLAGSFLHLLHSSQVRRMDLGELTYLTSDSLSGTKRYFVVSAGIGFDASICEEAMRSKIKNFFNRIGLGALTYGGISLKQLFFAPKTRCSITLDERPQQIFDNCLFVSVLNHKYQGGGLMFCPQAVDDDGILDICYTDHITKPKVLAVLPSAYKGNHVRYKGIGIDKAQQIHIVYDRPLWVHTDGEVKTKATDISVRCLPSCLQFLI